MDHDELPALADKGDWLHQRATRARPVSGVHVDVLGPEAGGAVVRITVACDAAVAVRATEVLAGAREAPRQKAPRFVEPNGARRRDPSAGSPSRGRTSGRRSRYLQASDYLAIFASGMNPWLASLRPQTPDRGAPEVPFGRAARHRSGDVRCVRSVLVARLAATALRRW
jgi:hypothetical protein